MMVTDPFTDYIPVSDFSGLNFVLDKLLQEACRVIEDSTPIPTPTPSTTEEPVVTTMEPAPSKGDVLVAGKL